MLAWSNTSPQFVSRLILGALSEHEQRMLAVQLLKRDPQLRAEILKAVKPFEMFDAELMREYSQALDKPSAEAQRHAILQRAYDLAPDLDQLIRAFTFEDLFSLGEMSRKLFTWSMSEFLLSRSQWLELDRHRVKVSLYLSQTVIDVVEILGTAGHSPLYANVIEDVRGRIHAAKKWQELDTDEP